MIACKCRIQKGLCEPLSAKIPQKLPGQLLVFERQARQSIFYRFRTHLFPQAIGEDWKRKWRGQWRRSEDQFLRCDTFEARSETPYFQLMFNHFVVCLSQEQIARIVLFKHLKRTDLSWPVNAAPAQDLPGTL